MIISRIIAGIGNQLFQYAAGRRLAYKLGTEFKLDISRYKDGRGYALNLFNVHEDLATPEEVEQFKSQNLVKREAHTYEGIFMPEVLDYPDDVYLEGFWENERYFADIADIIKEEFTLKNPLSPDAEAWKQKILSAECPVALHVRRGDFLTHGQDKFAVLPLVYYYECVNDLKQRYKNLTVFVFSNEIGWCKDHFKLDVPIEFISGGGYQLSKTSI